MNNTDDLEELGSVRDGVPPMSARAYQAGRRRLREEMADPTTRHSRLLSRRLLISGALAGALTAGFISYQLTAPAGSQTAAAAEILTQAADAVAPAKPLHPRPDQYVYRETLLLTNGLKNRSQSWKSADGRRPSMQKSRGDIINGTATLPVYSSRQGLANAPYLVLAALPTDPGRLLALLAKDPGVRAQVRGGSSQALAVWSLMRDMAGAAPPAQQAALFRAAANTLGIQRTDTAVKVAGQTGVAVGLHDPGLGRVEMVFATSDHHYLGERIVKDGQPDQVQFIYFLQRTAVVDRVGRLPA
ncbi:CU044_5270 family protein [Streptomyces sp. NBC_00258]|uniref:CU044_5270 family protein n=1 Tax=Streptomyces sp. NBC_00258 TaxID=2903642 RepID=UPI002E2DBFD0|nr:CU044_5270 family protein [Streptomyces sp. NBC_00258]